MAKFVFLICSERSGSNFITSLLNGHTAICGPPPTHMFRLFAINAGHYGDLSIDANWDALISDAVLNFDCKLGVWYTALRKDALKNRARCRTVAEPLRILYEEEAAADGASHIFVKENHTYLFVPFLLTYFPDCQFIFMVRDPRDVASSWVSTESIPGGVEKAVDAWVKDQENGQLLFQQLRGTGRILFLRYENLIAAPEIILQDIMRFLGLDYEERMLEFYKHPRVRENASRIDAWSNLSKPVAKHNAGKYRRTLSEADIRYVELNCLDLMSIFGYEPILVRERPEPVERDRELARLKPLLNAGNYVIRGDDERRIREQRLAAIDRVLQRRL